MNKKNKKYYYIGEKTAYLIVMFKWEIEEGEDTEQLMDELKERCEDLAGIYQMELKVSEG